MGISRERTKNAANKNVEEENREGYWPVYDVYNLDGHRGSRCLYAPRALDVNVLNGEWVSYPLSQGSVGLFLEFANWPVECGMDKATAVGVGTTLDTDRNAIAAKKWAEIYGVLGLGKNPGESHHIGGSSSLSLTTASYIGDRTLSHDFGRASRMSPRGGRHEKVAEFAREAWEAHVALRLYVLASRKKLEVEAITGFMDDTPVHYSIASQNRLYPSERELYTYDEWTVRDWAVGLVNEAVMQKVETTCYPAVFGSPGEYVQGWGFKSLLGAMWLQMMWLMVAEDNTCDWCGEPFDSVSEGRKRRFCDNGGRCKSAWNYHKGKGKSGKGAKKQERLRQARSSHAN